MRRAPRKSRESYRPPNPVDEALQESFPASDPPSFTAVRGAGAPAPPGTESGERNPIDVQK